MSRIHFRTFATEGRGHDSGKNLVARAQALTHRCDKHFASAAFITLRELRELFPENADRLGDLRGDLEARVAIFGEATWNRDWAAIGHLLWKPLALKAWLSSDLVEPGDVVFYNDCDFKKYPDYLTRPRQTADFIDAEIEGKHALVFSDSAGPLLEGIKVELLEKHLDPKMWRAPRLWAGAVAVRKSSSGIAFVDSWLHECSAETLDPLSNRAQLEGFVWNTGEQAALSIVWYRDYSENPGLFRLVDLREGRAIPPLSTLDRRIINLRVKFTNFLYRRYLRIFGGSSRPRITTRELSPKGKRGLSRFTVSTRNADPRK